MDIAAPLMEITCTVDEMATDERLDVFLASRGWSISRSQIKRAADEGRILVNGRPAKPNHRLKTGDAVLFRHEEPASCALLPEDIPLSVLYEDVSICVVNKPAGMVVHPAAGNYRGTLVNALLFHCRDLSGIGGVMRPGIVHRLDKDTSGVMVVAKSDAAHRDLSRQFAEHGVEKHYTALVVGDMRQDQGVVEAAIGRHPKDRKRMSVQSSRGKAAVTVWRVSRRFGVATLLDVRIMTGRTHQIRVHLNSIGHPIIGDSVYGNALRTIRDLRDDRCRKNLLSLRRQALHAARLSFDHPLHGERVEFVAPLPEDMASVCESLEDSCADHA